MLSLPPSLPHSPPNLGFPRFASPPPIKKIHKIKKRTTPPPPPPPLSLSTNLFIANKSTNLTFLKHTLACAVPLLLLSQREKNTAFNTATFRRPLKLKSAPSHATHLLCLNKHITAPATLFCAPARLATHNVFILPLQRSPPPTSHAGLSSARVPWPPRRAESEGAAPVRFPELPQAIPWRAEHERID